MTGYAYRSVVVHDHGLVGGVGGLQQALDKGARAGWRLVGAAAQHPDSPGTHVLVWEVSF